MLLFHVLNIGITRADLHHMQQLVVLALLVPLSVQFFSNFWSSLSMGFARVNVKK